MASYRQGIRLNEAKGQSDETSPTDPKGAYEMTVIMREEQAKDLASKMREVFNTDEKAKVSNGS